MGNSLIEQKQELMFQNYKLLGQQGKLKLYQQKGTNRTFALHEECYANKSQYDKKFKKLTQKQCLSLSDNILQLVKLWSKEHSGICSHLYKIYALYQYPQVKLIDQIQARKRQNKYFEEVELFSIIQSCLNAISIDSSYLNISPHCIFILPQGQLKLLHPQLIDRNSNLMYDQNYYYSPQKMANFSQYHQNLDKLQKETIFSLGMTILHCVLLESPKFCYEITMKRFNYRKLQVLLSSVTSLQTPHLYHLLSKMLSFNPLQRPTFDELQTSLNLFFSNGVSLVSSLYRSNCQQSKIQLNPLQKQNDINTISGKTSLDTLNRVVGSNKEDLFINIPKDILQLNDMNLKELPFTKERLPYKMDIQSVRKAKGKQNLFSDQKIIGLIREGMQKIYCSNINREKNSLSIVQNKNQFLTLSQYKQELNNQFAPLFVSNQSRPTQNNNNSKCTFVIQTYQDQTHFQGMLCNGEKQGYGKLTYPDGVYYQGNFEKDTLHGRGSLYYAPNRPAYMGDWNHNKFHGNGVLYNEFPSPLLLTFNYQDFNKLDQGWIKYEGQFTEDIKCGKGRIILSNGELMQGIFENGLLNGQGSFTDLYGKKVQGIWKDNVLLE